MIKNRFLKTGAIFEYVELLNFIRDISIKHDMDFLPYDRKETRELAHKCKMALAETDNINDYGESDAEIFKMFSFTSSDKKEYVKDKLSFLLGVSKGKYPIYLKRLDNLRQARIRSFKEDNPKLLVFRGMPDPNRPEDDPLVENLDSRKPFKLPVSSVVSDPDTYPLTWRQNISKSGIRELRKRFPHAKHLLYLQDKLDTLKIRNSPDYSIIEHKSEEIDEVRYAAYLRAWEESRNQVISWLDIGKIAHDAFNSYHSYLTIMIFRQFLCSITTERVKDSINRVYTLNEIRRLLSENDLDFVFENSSNKKFYHDILEASNDLYRNSFDEIYVIRRIFELCGIDTFSVGRVNLGIEYLNYSGSEGIIDKTKSYGENYKISSFVEKIYPTKEPAVLDNSTSSFIDFYGITHGSPFWAGRFSRYESEEPSKISEAMNEEIQRKIFESQSPSIHTPYLALIYTIKKSINISTINSIYFQSLASMSEEQLSRKYHLLGTNLDVSLREMLISYRYFSFKLVDFYNTTNKIRPEHIYMLDVPVVEHVFDIEGSLKSIISGSSGNKSIWHDLIDTFTDTHEIYIPQYVAKYDYTKWIDIYDFSLNNEAKKLIIALENIDNTLSTSWDPDEIYVLTNYRNAIYHNYTIPFMEEDEYFSTYFMDNPGFLTFMEDAANLTGKRKIIESFRDSLEKVQKAMDTMTKSLDNVIFLLASETSGIKLDRIKDVRLFSSDFKSDDKKHILVESLIKHFINSYNILLRSDMIDVGTTKSVEATIETPGAAYPGTTTTPDSPGASAGPGGDKDVGTAGPDLSSSTPGIPGEDMPSVPGAEVEPPLAGAASGTKGSGLTADIEKKAVRFFSIDKPVGVFMTISHTELEFAQMDTCGITRTSSKHFLHFEAVDYMERIRVDETMKKYLVFSDDNDITSILKTRSEHYLETITYDNSTIIEKKEQ